MEYSMTFFRKMAASRSSCGVQRVLAKCQACIDEGNFYEAHQMYRTLYYRYVHQKKYTEAIDLLYNGSLSLLKNNQHASGSDLAMLLIECLKESSVDVSVENIDGISGMSLESISEGNRTISIFNLMDVENPNRQPYLISAIKWSSHVDKIHKSGHPDLHQRFAIIFWQEKNYAQAHYHFIHSCDGTGCAAMLIEFHVTQGFPSELDLFITQAVLQRFNFSDPNVVGLPLEVGQLCSMGRTTIPVHCNKPFSRMAEPKKLSVSVRYLCLKNQDTANVVFYTYTREHPAVEKGPPFVTPLLNFIWFLLLALDGGKVAVFTILCEKYQASLNRDPTYREYLDRIGQLFFGLPPPKSPSQGGLFGNLLSSLMGGDDDEEAAADFTNTNTHTSQVPTRAEKTLDLD